MPIQFEMTVPHGDGEITIKSDDYKQLHEAAGQIADLQRDYRYLKSRGADSVVLNYRESKGYKYYGFGNANAYEHVSFGQLMEGGIIPFFPKGEEGYYKHDSKQASSRRSEAPPVHASNDAPTFDPDTGLPF